MVSLAKYAELVTQLYFEYNEETSAIDDVLSKYNMDTEEYNPSEEFYRNFSDETLKDFTTDLSKCIHKKVFWLSQINEMRWQAREIVKQMASPNERVQNIIDEYHAGLIKRSDLEEKIFEEIKNQTEPRERESKQLDFFN